MLSASSAILKTTPLGPGPMLTLDFFLFCVYHKDQYPQGNGRMEAPFLGNGSDFNDRAPYRIYHGGRIPGFPQHPHRGFETITATVDGNVQQLVYMQHYLLVLVLLQVPIAGGSTSSPFSFVNLSFSLGKTMSSRGHAVVQLVRLLTVITKRLLCNNDQ